MSMRSILIILLLMVNQPLLAQDLRQAMIASLQGTVQVLTPSGQSKEGEGTLLYDGKQYRFSKAKVGEKIKSREVVMTSTDGKAKVIYDHGDVVIIGPSSSLVIPGLGHDVASSQNMELNYGRVRAVVDKDGPMSGLKIKTPSAVAGVRGTDLYVQYNIANDQTEVQVLRGEVELKSQVAQFPQAKKTFPTTLPVKGQKLNNENKILKISAGDIGQIEIKKMDLEEQSQKVEVRAEVKSSTQHDLGRVQKETTVVKSLESLPAPVERQVNEAEAKAVANIIKDIQRYNPKAADKISAKKPESVEAANTMSVYEIYKQAPKSPEKTKPTTQDLMDKDDDVYNQYFKPLNL